MKTLYVVTTRVTHVDPVTHDTSLDPVLTQETPIQFDSAYLYYADSAEHAMEKSRHSIFGPDLPVSAREFTDEEYRLAFEKSDCRKVEWLKETLGLDQFDRTLDGLSNKKLKLLVEAISNRFGVPITYR